MGACRAGTLWDACPRSTVRSPDFLMTVLTNGARSPGGDDWPAMVRLRDRIRAEIAQRTGERLVERAAVVVS